MATSRALSPAPPDPLRIWIAAARPKTLPAAVAPVLVGAAIAHHHDGFAAAPAAAALAGAVLLQVAANFANDVFDYERGADTEERLGPTRAVQAGWVSPRQMRIALGLCLAAALAVGTYLVAVGGAPILILGLCAMAAAVAYTGGPYPLGYHGLGDVFVLLFFGFAAVGGTTFVQIGTVPELSLWAGAGIGALATAILVVNNLRDAATDAVAGKRTLVVRFGQRFALTEYATLLSLPYLAAVVAWLRGLTGPWALLALASAPLAGALVRDVAQRRGERLNPLLGRTALLLACHAALTSVGLLLDATLGGGS